MYEESWDDWKASRGARAFGRVLLSIVLLVVLVASIRGCRESIARRRTRVTLTRIRDISVALENHASKAGRYPCVRSMRELPAGILAPSRESSDGWGHPIQLIANAGNYVVFSFGSDGKADVAYTGNTFYADTGDLVMHNGAWVHHPHLSMPSDRLPMPSEAFASVATCGPAA
ncbi:MAG TPA: hypothetical protein VEK79_07945 [Thermoanaerobaculia bacterium]|nr:hypothetical protein [Thermoanaerobaculia bacterium]